jgi:non-heme Fe2+,alpha-ketoglutarate-dependent halogenase
LSSTPKAELATMTYHHFQPEYVPKRDLEPEALAFHKAVTEEQLRVLYRGTDKNAYRA